MAKNGQNGQKWSKMIKNCQGMENISAKKRLKSGLMIKTVESGHVKKWSKLFKYCVHVVYKHPL